MQNLNNQKYFFKSQNVNIVDQWTARQTDDPGDNNNPPAKYDRSVKSEYKGSDVNKQNSIFSVPYNFFFAKIIVNLKTDAETKHN